jgi:hypothetical protein
MPAPDVVEEAVRLLDAAERDRVPLKALGGVAIRLRTPRVPPALRRDYQDIDLVTARRRGADVSRLLEAAGYRADREFNALHGDRRLLFHDVERSRQIDVFVGVFAMCHEIPVAERLDLEPRTIPLAELLLTKLQIVEINDKDLRDAATVLLGHDVADRDGDAVNAVRGRLGAVAHIRADAGAPARRPARTWPRRARPGCGRGARRRVAGRHPGRAEGLALEAPRPGRGPRAVVRAARGDRRHVRRRGRSRPRLSPRENPQASSTAA